MTIQERALSRYGETRQLLKCAEEAAELAAAINRYLANPCDETVESVIEEAADMEVCAAYFRLIFCGMDIENYRLEKLARLERKLNNNINCGA